MFGYLRPIAILSYAFSIPVLGYRALQPIGEKTTLITKLAVLFLFIALISSLAAGWKFLSALRFPKLFMLGNVLFAIGTIGALIGNSLFEIFLVALFAAFGGAILASVTAFIWTS